MLGNNKLTKSPFLLHCALSNATYNEEMHMHKIHWNTYNLLCMCMHNTEIHIKATHTKYVFEYKQQQTCFFTLFYKRISKHKEGF